MGGTSLFRGPFSSTGTYGSAESDDDTPSVRTVTLGDFNGDGSADLVGDPDEPEKNGVDGALGGRVPVWRGTAKGIRVRRQARGAHAELRGGAGEQRAR
ncbi:hypothetical protein ACFYXS_28215 [Streptomyces sp. NPDC002574]|uniref:hypothetical protein n=1 Tax=Streptomyces sp. NPDC002574 TaxID=3364652 RepID=UPI00368F0732